MNCYIVKLICEAGDGHAVIEYEVIEQSGTAALAIAKREHAETLKGRRVVGSIVSQPERASVRRVNTFPVTAQDLDRLKAAGVYIVG